MIRILIGFIFFICCHNLSAQRNIDSLISVYPDQPDSDRAITLGELCYQLAYNDSKRSIYYGKLGYEAAKASNDLAIVAQALNDWSIPYLIQGDFDSVLILCQEALDLRVELGDSIGVAKILSKIANANYELGKLPVSLQQNLRALAIFEANNLDELAGRISVNIGGIYEQNGLLEDGLQMYVKAKAIAKESENIIAYYTALLAEATCIVKLNRFEEADEKLHEALLYYTEDGNIDMMGTCYQNLGFNERLNNSSKKAKVYYNKALEMYRKNENKSAATVILTNLAQISMDRGQLEIAEEHLTESLKSAEEINSLHLLENTYRGFIRLENLKGNFQKADQYFELYTEKMDSLYNDETNFAISEMKIKYDTDRKAKELESQQLINKNNRLLLLIALAVIGILVLIIVLVGYRKRMQSERLEMQGLKKLEIERKRIARDLHDNLGAELVLISSKIDSFAFGNKDESLNSMLNDIGKVSINANQQLRETIWSIHKSSISIEELAMKVGNYVERINENTGIEVIIEKESSHTMLSPALGLHLFRICQEMTNNTLKYADAKEIRVIFNENELIVSDNGVGFALETVRRGYGLHNINARVEEFNGDMNLTSSSNGTKLIVRFS